MFICNCPKVYGKNFKVTYEHTESCKKAWRKYRKTGGRKL